MKFRFGATITRLLVAFCAVFFVISLPVSAESSQSTSSAEPYTADEFPSWALDLRRGEVVAFGALPFMVFFATFAVDSYRYSQNDWDRRYAPWPIRSSNYVEMDESQRIASFAAGCAGAVFVAVIDYFIVKHKRRAATRTISSKMPATIDVEREDWPPVKELPTTPSPDADLSSREGQEGISSPQSETP